LVEQAKQFIKENGIKNAVLTQDDYFNKAVEFRMWLSEDFGLFIDDLPADEARKYFSKFVDKWNRGHLADKYYKGLSLASVEPASRTKYKWDFAAKLDPIELGTVRDTVDADTNKKFAAFRRDRPRQSREDPPPPPPLRAPLGPLAGPVYPKPNQEEEELDEEDRRRLDRLSYKKDAKSYLKRKEDVLDELLPKATGKEALIEKKKLRNEQHKRKDDSPEMNEDDLMGGSDNFHARLQREKERNLKKNCENRRGSAT